MKASEIRRWSRFKTFDSRDELIAGLYRLGFSSVQVGSWVGLSRARISQILAEQGVERRRPGIRTAWASSAEAQRIKREIEAILEDIEAAAT